MLADSMEQRHFLSGTAVFALVFLTAALSVTPGNAQVSCFSAINCGGTATMGGTIEDCCLGGGITFQTGGEACRACIVYGWLDGPNFTGDESDEPYPMAIGFIKGHDFGSGLVLSYSVEVTEGSAGEGANADFTVTNRNLLHRTTTTTNPAASASLRVDELAQETDETFQMTLVPNPASPASAFSGTNEFLLDTITVTIIDQQRVTFSFPESDYTGPEQDKVITVRVRRNTRIANPVTLLIVPLNYTEYNDSGFVQPIDFPEVPPENMFTPNRAKSLPLDRRDFNITPIEITFEADENNAILVVSVPITIFDDEINEVEEEIFVAVLELVDAINSSIVDFSDATLCRITDNDPIFIGFERPQYQFNETETVFTEDDSPILIIKENGVVSEQIFRVTITAGAADLPGIGNALFQPNPGDIGDYSLGQPSQTLVYFFEAEEQSRGFRFAIRCDTLPEEAEAFRLTIATTSGEGGQFSVGTIGSTVVIIEDDDKNSSVVPLSCLSTTQSSCSRCATTVTASMTLGHTSTTVLTIMERTPVTVLTIMEHTSTTLLTTMEHTPTTVLTTMEHTSTTVLTTMEHTPTTVLTTVGHTSNDVPRTSLADCKCTNNDTAHPQTLTPWILFAVSTTLFIATTIIFLVYVSVNHLKPAAVKEVPKKSAIEMDENLSYAAPQGRVLQPDEPPHVYEAV